MTDRYDKYFRVHPALFFALEAYVNGIMVPLHRKGDLMIRHDSTDDSWWVRGTWQHSVWHRLHA